MPDQDPALEGQDNPDALAFIPENFRRGSVEESAKAILDSYKELQGTHTRVSQEKAAIEDNYAEIASRLDELAASQQPAQQQVDQNSQLQALAEQYGVEPEYVNAAAMIAQQTAQLILQQNEQKSQPQTEAQVSAHRELVVDRAESRLSVLYPDFAELKDKVYEQIKNNPNLWTDDQSLSVQKTEDAFASIYKQVKYDELVSGAAEGGEQQPNVADLVTRMKLNAQTAAGASGRPDPISDEKASWDAIKNAKPDHYYK